MTSSPAPGLLTFSPKTSLPVPSLLASIRWGDAEVLSLLVTLGTLLLGGLGPALGLPAAWSPVFYFAAYLAGGWHGVIHGAKSLCFGVIDVDLLMILAALGAAYVHHAFEGALLLFLFSLSHTLQELALEKSRSAISALIRLRPDTALCRRCGIDALIKIEELVIGDLVLVRPGENIPVDGVVVGGYGTVDQSSLTGESFPIAKKPGDPLFAGTLNGSGGLDLRVTRLAAESTLAKLIALVEQAQNEKAQTERFLEKTEQSYAVGVIVFTLLLIAVPYLLFHQNFQTTFYQAMTVMVVASPCALVISTPATLLSAIATAARRGILFKGGVHLEQASRLQIVAFDKTGTLTEGHPRVTDLLVISRPDETVGAVSCREEELLWLAAAVESRSEHPLAHSILNEAKRRFIPIEPCLLFQSVAGQGVSAQVAGRRIAVGNLKFFADFPAAERALLEEEMNRLSDEGKSVTLVAEVNNFDSPQAEIHYLGVIAVADRLRADAAAMIARLKLLGIGRIVMLTGDTARVAHAVGRMCGIDEVQADLLPQEKVRAIQDLKLAGKTAMVGDGVNDAPALACADVGIAMGAAGTDVAMQTADIVLMSESLDQIPFTLALSYQARRVVTQNLVVAFGVILVMVSAALILPRLGLVLPLPVGVICHEGSTVLVCLNGLRLLAFRG